MFDREDDDEKHEAAQQRREWRSFGRAGACLCLDQDMGGRCPGPENCPHADTDGAE